MGYGPRSKLAFILIDSQAPHWPREPGVLSGVGLNGGGQVSKNYHLRIINMLGIWYLHTALFLWPIIQLINRRLLPHHDGSMAWRGVLSWAWGAYKEGLGNPSTRRLKLDVSLKASFSFGKESFLSNLAFTVCRLCLVGLTIHTCLPPEES